MSKNNSGGFQMPHYWFARTDEEGAGPTYVVGRGDEEITHPCLFRHEAQAIVAALNTLAQGESTCP